MSEAEDEAPLRLFQGFGVEIEYMIVDAASLDVCPVAELLLRDAQGDIEDEIERGAFAWSNELAAHVIELKTNGPARGLEGLAEGFQQEVRAACRTLGETGARLLPTGMHPWMDPEAELRLWTHGDRRIYATFDRIFDCRGHGWANLQSVHLNLPFGDDEEFGRLHAAIRALLPLLPALAASSPFADGRHPGFLDTRLEVYRTNARRVPSVSGEVVPEPVFTRRAYDALLEGIYDDLGPLDPDGVLRHEWVNARGCIARFDRSAIEIRVLDVQECPRADLAIAAGVAAVLRGLCEGESEPLRRLPTAPLARLLRRTAAQGEAAQVEDADYLEALGLPGAPRSAAGVWRGLLARHGGSLPDTAAALPLLERILAEGCLARRILRRTGPEPDREGLRRVYRELADCLLEGRPLLGGA